MNILCAAGVAKAFDQGCVVHCIWLALAKLGCGVWIERVPTAENLADLPSRHVVTSGICAQLPSLLYYIQGRVCFVKRNWCHQKGSCLRHIFFQAGSMGGTYPKIHDG